MRTGFLLSSGPPRTRKQPSGSPPLRIHASDHPLIQYGSMADDIEAELKAAGKELDKVRFSRSTICHQASNAANKPPGRGDRAYVGAASILSASLTLQCTDYS
jgi:hypothetical protein